ncbi:TPA: hypothetical protein NH701_003134 [Pseudomonas aeruginosa]|nr:hypothetical protein [Pseudomonas aeruginosa]
MINLILGQPGGGKSHEAVVYHVVPALNQGRKVITNLALDMDKFKAFFPESWHLIELRDSTVEVFDNESGEEESRVVRPFSRVDHYADPWRHPDEGFGPLYVIDECHLSIPLRGTPVPVEEWYSLHRHELADVLLITQSYGKINRAIRDLVQVVYRCKKATAFGTNDRYIRKVQDGLRGEVVNTSIREYQKQFYGFWKSHTRSSAAGQELAANDIVPIWKRWPFKGAALCFLIVICLSTWNVTREKKHAPPPRVQPVAASVDSAPVGAAPAVPAAPVIEAKPRGPEQKLHPFQGLSMHLIATMRGKRFRDGVEEEFLGGFIQLANNGQPVSKVSFDDLRTAGYSITWESPTVVSLTYKGFDIGYVVTDMPLVSAAKDIAVTTPVQAP